MIQNKLFQWFKFLLGWPLSLLAIMFLAKLVLSKSSSIIPNISQINYLFVGISILCFFLFYVMRAYIWTEILEQKKERIPLKESAFLWGSSELKRYIPGNIWSFMGRVLLFQRNNLSKKDILHGLAIEQELVIIGGLIASIFGLNILRHAFFPSISQNAIILIYCGMLIVLLILFTTNNRFLHLTSNQGIKKVLGLFPLYTLTDKASFILLYTTAFFFYGLGTYFSILGVVFLKPDYLFEYISYFSLALIIGYITIITPAGLGVREIVVTQGLTVFLIPLNIASFASLFSRILLIISEVIFLAFSYLWYKSKSKFITKVTSFIATHIQKMLLALFALLYLLYFGVGAILRYNNYYTGRFDLGNMDQAVWNSLHGRIFQVTDPNGTNIISRLAFHADFILILLSPFYLFWSDPRMLLIIQTVVVACGSICIYLLGMDILKNKNYALVMSGIFLLYPALQYANLYDFHPVTLATTFFLVAFYFLRNKRYTLMVVFLLLGGLTKEEEWLIVALFGVYIFFYFKERILGLLLFLAGIFLAWYLAAYAIPHALGSEHFALSYYSDFGSSPSGVIKNIIIHPLKTMYVLGGSGQRLYLLQLFEPIGFISFFSPLFLIFIIPEFMLDLLSNNPQLHQIYYQYSSPLTPFIFISALYGTSYVLKKFTIIPGYVLMSILLLCSFFGAYQYGPLPGAKHPNLDMYTKPVKDAGIIDDYLTDIPSRFSIAATNNLGSHLSHRQKIFTIPIGIDKADIILFLLNDPYAQPSLHTQKQMAENMRHDAKYVEVYHVNDFVVFERKNLKRVL